MGKNDTSSPVRPMSEVGLVRSLDRALAILDALAAQPQGVGLSDLSRHVGIAKSTAHRLLSTLEYRGFVVRCPEDGRYIPGPKVAGVIDVMAAPRLRAVLEDLARQSGESVNVGVLHGTDIVYVERVESRHALRWELTVGSRVPAYCSGMGKAILADLPPAVRQDVLRAVPLRRLSHKTITDPVALDAELRRVQAAGYAIDDEEYMDGVLCIAAAVRRGHRVIGAVSIAGPALRFTREVALAHRPALFRTVRAVAGLVGIQPSAEYEE